MAITFIDPSLMPFATTFLFVFAVVYALLNYSGIFIHRDKDGNPKGEIPRKVYALIAIVFAAFSATYEPLVTGLQQYIPYAAAVLILLFLVVFAKKIFGGKKDNQHFDAFATIFALGVMLLIVGIFWDQITRYLPSDFQSFNILWIIGVVVIIAIFYAVHKHKPGS